MSQTETPNNLSAAEKADLVKAAVGFPVMLDLAITDWEKFKLGVAAGLFNYTWTEKLYNWFSNSPGETVLNWYKDFPRYWQLMRPNFEIQTGDGNKDLALLKTKQKADAFVTRLTGEKLYIQGLGIAPIIIAGIIVAGILGVAGVTWAIGYIKKQYNISEIIDQTVAGKIPADVLQKAIEESGASSSPFADIAGLIKWGLIGVAVIMVWPYVQGFLGSRGRAK